MIVYVFLVLISDFWSSNFCLVLSLAVCCIYCDKFIRPARTYLCQIAQIWWVWLGYGVMLCFIKQFLGSKF